MINGINLTDFYATKVLISKLENFFIERRRDTLEFLIYYSEPSSPEEQLSFSMSNNNNYQSITEVKPRKSSEELLSVEEYNERLKHLKLGILHLKLLSLTKIIKKEVKFRFVFFIEKMRLKTNMEHLFKTDDNFLYFFPQQKFFKFANNYAYKKLSYVFKSYKYRMNFLIRNVFQIWRFKSQLTSLVTTPEKSSLIGKHCSTLIEILNTIVVKHQLIHAIQKLVFFFWVNISKQDQYSQVRIHKGFIFLSEFFIKHKREVFYALPHRNFAFNKLLQERLLKHLSDNPLYQELLQNDSRSRERIEKTLLEVVSEHKEAKKRNYSFRRKNKLLKLFTKLNLKNTFNKDLYMAYRKLKQLTDKKIKEEDELNALNDIVTDLKCDSLLNGSLLIAAFFKRRMLCSVLFLKQMLFDRLISKATMKNTLFEYAEKYQEIISMLPKERRLDLLIVRNKYKKIFKLKKILLTLFKHQFDLNDNNHSAQKRYLEGCFYRWKAYICESVRRRNLKIFLFSHITIKLQQKIVLNVRNQFLTNLIITAYAKTEKMKYEEQSYALILKKVKKLLFSRKLSVFFNVFLKLSRLSKRKEAYAKRLVAIYSKRFKLKKQFSFTNKLYLYLSKWLHLTQLLFNSKELGLIDKRTLRTCYVLSNLSGIINSKRAFTALKTWRSKVKKHYPKSNNGSIDAKIFMNMSAILQEYEIEDTKVKHDIIKKKFAMVKGRSLLRCIFSKHFHTLMHFFMLWKRSENYSEAYADLLAQAEDIKTENEGLIKTYYDTKKQYKKIIFDYEYMKKHYCDKCMGEKIDVDYKSINDEVLTDGNNQEGGHDGLDGREEDNKARDYDSEEMRVDSQEDNRNQPNKVNRTAEKENLIKEYQNEYKNQLKYYEEYMATMKRKKEDLISIKKMLLDKKNKR